MGECFLYRRGNGGGGGASALPEEEKTVLGRSLVLTDSTSKPLKGLRLFGRTTQAGTPSPDNPVPLVSVGDGGSITVEVGASNVDQNPQRLVCNTPNGLPGIPVSSGGNMADENGQQWVCDEIDFAMGKYVHRVVKVGIEAFNRVRFVEDSNWHNSELTYAYEVLEDLVGFANNRITGACNVMPTYSFENFYGRGIVDGCMNNFTYLVVNLNKSRGIDTIDKFKAWCSEVGFKVVKPLAEPIETDLTAEELAQYAALHTNSLYTTISNTAGADMEVTYVAIGG